MNGDDYRDAIEHLGMTQVGSARFLGVNDRTPRNWISGKYPVPVVVSMLLNVMVKKKISPKEVLAIDHRTARLAP